MPKKSHPDLSFRFTDNRLAICRNGTSVYEITVWPKPHAEARDNFGRWNRFYPEIRLIDYPLRKPKEKKVSPQLELGLGVNPPEQKKEMTKREAYDLLRQSMPFAYAIALAPFQSHQWNLLILLSMKRRFYDLLKSNPVLAYYLANDMRVMTMIYRKELMMEKLTGMPQTDLLKLLDLPQTKSAVKLLRKVHPASVSPAQYLLLRTCIQSEERMKKLAHLKKVNIGALKLAAAPAECQSAITPQLLEDVSADVRNNFHPSAANSFEEMTAQHRHIYPGRPLPILRSLEELDARHEEIMNAYTDHQSEKQLGPLPPPPIEGTADIVPLRSGEELRNEGIMQHNCVGGFTGGVRAGHTFIYKVLAPERATLSIVKGAGGEWIVSQLNAACNKPVKESTHLAVEEWLRAPQLGI
jgi:hypothetical protein